MEQVLSEGIIVTFDNVTAASNMSAGEMVGISGHTVYHITSATIDNTAVLGYSFIGVLDEDISAGASPITVHTEGLFPFLVASGATDANLIPGNPVWTDGSGYVTTPGPDGDAAIGVIVGMSNNTYASTGGAAIKALVKISPMAYKWSIAFAATSATGPIAGSFPALSTR